VAGPPGPGAFADAVHYDVGDSALGSVAADFNEDCIVDLAVLNNISNDISILLGNPAPGEWNVDEIVLARSETDDTQLSWSPAAGAAAYDLIRGDLAILRASGGDFAAATASCLEDSVASAASEDADVPGAGIGFWYLVRPEDACGAGSYDALASSQAMPRDAAIEASGLGCP